MSKMISKKDALKVFCYLISPEDSSPIKSDRFEEIVSELLGEDHSEMTEDVLSECKRVLDSIKIEDDRYDVICEEIDKALTAAFAIGEEGVAPRLLLWDMLTLSHSDPSSSDMEKDLIDHVAQTLRIDKSVFAEMKLLISASAAISDERKALESAAGSSDEKKEMILEMDKRQQNIIGAVTALIGDDPPVEPLEDENKRKKKTGRLFKIFRRD